MKDHHKIAVLLGIGAVAYLVYSYMQQPAPGSNGSMVSDDAVAQPPAYPQNPTPAAASNIDIGGSPINLTYNYGDPLPTMAIGGNTQGECGCDTFCDQAGQKVTVQTVPPEMLASANDNFSGWVTKQQVPVGGGNGGIVPGGATLVQGSKAA